MDDDNDKCEKLWYSCRAGDLNSVKELLDSGADVNEVYAVGVSFLDDEVTHLMSAVMIGREDIVEELLNRGANMNAVNIEGTTALTLSVYGDCKFLDIAKILIRRGCNWRYCDKSGETFLSLLSDEDKNMMEDYICSIANVKSARKYQTSDESNP